MNAANSKIAGTPGKLRACLGCSIVKSASYFKQHGCPNCPTLQLNKIKNFNLATSASFRGAVGLIEPKKSWVAKWQRIDNFVPGTYAMTVEGELGDEFVDRLEQDGRVYFNRSASFTLN